MSRKVLLNCSNNLNEIAETAREIIKAKQQNANAKRGGRHAEAWTLNEADTKELEGKIDKLVYRLYDLTAEEINIVEGKA